MVLKQKAGKRQKKKKSNVTQKTSNAEKKKRTTNKGNKKSAEKTSKKNKSQVKDYLAVVTEKQSEGLTEKELLFCFYFVNVHQFNATQSYQKAFGCSYESARRLGSLILTKVDIRAEIDRLKKIKYQSILVQEEDLVEKHMRIAFASITDFVEFGQTEVPIISGGKLMTISRPVINGETGQEEMRPFPVTKIVNDVRFKESSEVDGSLIKSIKVGKDGASIELLDPQKSMEWLERYFAWNPMDKHKVAFDKAKLQLEEEKLKLAQRKAGEDGGDEITDDGFIDALNAEAPSVWSDEDED